LGVGRSHGHFELQDSPWLGYEGSHHLPPYSILCSSPFPITQGGLGIIDPKAQSKTLLAKLLTRGLAPRGEPWKELIRHRADQTRLQVHSKEPSTANINWIFAAMKLKKTRRSMWDNIIRVWLNVRPGLTKTDPTNNAEILRQPLFENPSILNSNDSPLGITGLSEGNAFAHSGCSRVKDLRNAANTEWKKPRQDENESSPREQKQPGKNH
jgi:hypothetical protein